MSFHNEPVPFPVFVAIFAGAAALVGLVRKFNKTPPLGPDARRLLPLLIVVVFVFLAAANAFGNWRLGLPQF